MKLSIASLSVALLAGFAAADYCEHSELYCGSRLKTLERFYQEEMEDACLEAGKSCVGDKALNVLFECYTDAFEDMAVQIKDFECKKTCVVGGKGKNDYCGDEPAKEDEVAEDPF